MKIDKDKIYKLNEMAKITGYSPSTLRRRINSGKLKPMSEAGEDIRIWGSELLRFLKK